MREAESMAELMEYYAAVFRLADLKRERIVSESIEAHRRRPLPAFHADIRPVAVGSEVNLNVLAASAAAVAWVRHVAEVEAQVDVVGPLDGNGSDTRTRFATAREKANNQFLV